MTAVEPLMNVLYEGERGSGPHAELDAQLDPALSRSSLKGRLP